MANPEHLQILQQGVEVWNAWREQNDDITPDLRKANLSWTNLDEINLDEINLDEINLDEVNLDGATLIWAKLPGATLTGASLPKATLTGATLAGAKLLGATLTGADLDRATLAGADLDRATLTGATLAWATLAWAKLPKANLTGANLTGADLDRATLTGATLTGATLTGANFTGADLSKVQLVETVFGNTNLTTVQGLETCVHDGPSILDHRTLMRSGPLPLAFLRGCGLNDWEIEATKLYQPGLTPTQINDIVYRIYDLRADPLFQFYSCFISYASRDHAFVERLYEDLQNNGVRCWFAQEDMKIGDRIRDTIEQQIRLRQKLLIVLSSASIASTWVENEVEAALEEERMSPERRTVLVPITIDHTVEETNLAWARTIKRTRYIGDFTRWEDKDAYQKALVRLLRDLNIVERKLGG